jgi:hypothetical protein
MDPHLQQAIRSRMAQRHAEETIEALDQVRRDNLRLASEQKAIQKKHAKAQAQILGVLEQQEIARQKQEAALQNEKNYQNALFRINEEFNKLKSKIPTANTDEVATGLVESFLACEHQCKELTILKQEHYSALEYKQLCGETTSLLSEVKKMIDTHIPEYLTMVLQKIEDEIRRQEEEKRRVTEEARRKKEAKIAKQKAAKQRRIEEERIRQIEAERKEEERLKQKKEFNKKIMKGALYFSPVALVAFLCFIYIST